MPRLVKAFYKIIAVPDKMEERKINVTAKTYQKGEIQGVIAINASTCKGCDACKRYCPTDAITGMFGATHSIDIDLCLRTTVLY